MRRVGALRARRIPLREAFLFLNFSLSFEKEIRLGLLIQSFSSCYLCTSASGRAYFSFLHAPFVSKMAVVNPPSFPSRGLALQSPGACRFRACSYFSDVSRTLPPEYFCPSRYIAL